MVDCKDVVQRGRRARHPRREHAFDICGDAHEPDPAAATAEHIRLFWDPWMKDGLFSNGSDGLSAVAAAAMSKLSA